ncbi:MAG: response regulator [Candidatus Aminicenantes bacterium]|jgi:response regulator RpfG family c-di-GMP phosphodiesterase
MKENPVKILIVDDDEGNNNVLRLTLTDDYRVLLARDSHEALEILSDKKEHHDIRAIITDQRMPGMSGMELLKRSVKTHPHTLRIIVTGYPDLDALNKELDTIGIHKIFYKPLTDQKIEELRHFLQESIGK